ncbi:MAG: hypothetical protein EKK41_13590 [Hyphomicrobiales bacterium]|nr:MAG: hypothetical protein EKK41_13590 [Hyphomicrobiales bacterium]
MAVPNITTFAQAGAVFNDATRQLEGGLWQNTVEEGGQGFGSAKAVAADLQALQTGLQAQINAGQFTGDTLAKVQGIVASLGEEAEAAAASVSGGGAFGSVAAAETALRNIHLGIIDTVKGDATLAAMATADGGNGFQSVPPAFAAGVTAANAPHENLAQIGAIFDDAANLMLGGINSSNVAAIKADIAAAGSGLKHLMAAHPDEFGGLTGIHADTVVRQLALEAKFIDQVGTNPNAGRASNDNMLDIIDIVQGDTNLANMANQGGVAGFTAFPDKLNPTPKYLDNDAQTAFWASFIAQSNSLGSAAQAVVGSGDKAAINTLIGQLRTFEKNSANFDQSQGGIFEARFDNELAKGSSTLGAEVAAMIKGLKTGNAALVAAAADEMHANAADVGGNNIAANGATYKTDGMTVAEVLGTAVAQSGGGLAAAAPVPAPAAPESAAPPHAAPAGSPDDGGTHAMAHVDMHHGHGHFAHLWG